MTTALQQLNLLLITSCSVKATVRRTRAMAHWRCRLSSQPGSWAGSCPRAASAAPAICPGDPRLMENQAGWPDDEARTTVVSLPGEVCYCNAIQVHDELMAALEPRVTTVILDLTPTTFVGSAGLCEIADARRLASAYRIDLRLVVPPSTPLAGSLCIERIRPGAGDLSHPACCADGAARLAGEHAHRVMPSRPADKAVLSRRPGRRKATGGAASASRGRPGRRRASRGRW